MSLEITGFRWKVKGRIDEDSIKPAYVVLTFSSKDKWDKDKWSNGKWNNGKWEINLFVYDTNDLTELIEEATRLKNAMIEREIIRKEMQCEHCKK